MRTNSRQQSQQISATLKPTGGNLKEHTPSNQRFLQIAVSVNLDDCMKCYVKIPRLNVSELMYCVFDTAIINLFQIKDCENTINSKVHINIEDEVQAIQEETKTSIKQPNETLSEEVFNIETARLRSSYYADPYEEDFNPMNSCIIIDLPWPKTTQERFEHENT